MSYIPKRFLAIAILSAAFLGTTFSKIGRLAAQTGVLFGQQDNLEQWNSSSLRVEPVDVSSGTGHKLVSPVGRTNVIAYIYGLTKHDGDGLDGLNELQLSVASACFQTRAEKGASPLQVIIFVSEDDAAACQPSTEANATCRYLDVLRVCGDLPTPLGQHTVEVRPIPESFVTLLRTKYGMVKFYKSVFLFHKLWLPRLLHAAGVEKAIFLDTDTVWARAPEVLFREFDNFNVTQSIGACQIKGHKKDNFYSLMLRYRINSGLMLMHVGRLIANDFEGVLGRAIAANRRVPLGSPRPVGYNYSSHCQIYKGGDQTLPLCLTVPFDDGKSILGCDNRMCWQSGTGDQEFFSDVLSNEKPEWFYPLSWKKHHIHIQSREYVMITPARRRKKYKIENQTVVHYKDSFFLWAKGRRGGKPVEEQFLATLSRRVSEPILWLRRYRSATREHRVDVHEPASSEAD